MVESSSSLDSDSFLSNKAKLKFKSDDSLIPGLEVRPDACQKLEL